MADRFVQNDVVTLTNTFKVSGAATDPTTVSLTVVEPSGASTTYTYAAAQITKSSTGVFTKNITADSVGIWRYYWTGTGAAADVQDGSFTVSSVADYTTYTTVEELKDELGNYSSTDTTDDAKLQRAINAASRQIDNWCGQRFWQDSTVTARTFIADDPYLLDLEYQGEGIATSTGLAVALDVADAGSYGTSLTLSTDFLLRPENAAVLVPARPYTQISLTGATYLFSRSSYGRPLIQITAKWGWPAVPAEVNKACLIQAMDLAKPSPLGVAGTNDFGVLRVTSGLHRQAQALLAAYRRVAVG